MPVFAFALGLAALALTGQPPGLLRKLAESAAGPFRIRRRAPKEAA